MDHRRERLLIVGRDLARGLNYLTQGHYRGYGHEHRFLYTQVHRSFGWTIQRFFRISYSKNDAKTNGMPVCRPSPDHSSCRETTEGRSPSLACGAEDPALQLSLARGSHNESL
jgi:hypothetical protein